MTEETKSNLPAIKAVNSVPVISAEQYSHVGKYAGALVLSAFHQAGGMERFVAWIDSNYTDYATKIFPKLIQRSTAVEHSGSVTIDDVISRLEDADYKEIYDL